MRIISLKVLLVLAGVSEHQWSSETLDLLMIKLHVHSKYILFYGSKKKRIFFWETRHSWKMHSELKTFMSYFKHFSDCIV